jgi:superfamily II DNA or RNA helicase
MFFAGVNPFALLFLVRAQRSEKQVNKAQKAQTADRLAARREVDLTFPRRRLHSVRMKAAVLSNYLWIPKESVIGTPEAFAPDWTHRIELLKTPEGRVAQQQIAFLREQAIAQGDDPDEVAKDLDAEDELVINNWSGVGDWWALCAGDEKKVQRLLKYLKLEVKDRRVDAPWPEDLRGKLRVLLKPRQNQIEAMATWRAAGHGILKAAPAFGKTFVMISSVIEGQQYTIVLVHTDALADQFITRFRHGSPNDSGGFTPITNCLEVEEELGTKIIGRYEGPGKLFPVTVATWQSFIHPAGKKALKAVGKSFGRLLCDEAHVFAAPAPASVVNGFHCRKSGVSATPTRKDQMDIALYDIIGPVTAEGKAEQLPVTSYLISTGCKYPPRKYPGKADWARIINWQVKQEDRNELIFDWIRHDVETEDRNLLVLSDRVNWCLQQAELLTKQHGIQARAVIGGMNNPRGLKQRAEIIQAMLDRKIRVIFATSVFKAGIDIPNLDTLYYTAPQNNPEQLEQGLGRIRRPYEDKKSPVFRYFVDEGHGLLFGCARGTHKTLVNMGIEVVLVSDGTKPGAVHTTRSFDQEGEPAAKKRGLKAVTSKQSMSSIFTDLRQEENLKKEYNRRLRRD